MQIAAAAAFMVVIIALVGAFASYIANYYTESVGLRCDQCRGEID